MLFNFRKKTLFTSRYSLCWKAIADDLIEKVEALTIGQEANYLPSTDTSSTGSSFAGLDELEVKKIQLNEFLASCKVETFRPQNWLDWSNAHNLMRQRCINHTADAVVTLLKVVPPENAIKIWQALILKSSRQ